MIRAVDTPPPRLRRNLQVTPRQRAILEWTNTYIHEHGSSPTLDEIGEGIGVTKVTVLEHLNALQKKRLIQRGRHVMRSIQLATACYAPAAELAGPGIPTCAQCLVCDEFVYPPSLQIGEWEPSADEAGPCLVRKIETQCPHCDRLSVHVQRRPM